MTENEGDATREADIGEKPDIGADIGMSELWQGGVRIMAGS